MATTTKDGPERLANGDTMVNDPIISPMPLTLHENLDAAVSDSSNQQTAAQKKNVSSSDGPTKNNTDRKYMHKDGEMPGAVQVQQGGAATTTTRSTLGRRTSSSNESDNIAELDRYRQEKNKKSYCTTLNLGFIDLTMSLTPCPSTTQPVLNLLR